MNGKKFTMAFMGFIVVSAVFACLWMKQAYETRPKIQIEDEKK